MTVRVGLINWKDFLPPADPERALTVLDGIQNVRV